MVLVFDLDDTLYDEITYMYSGFKEVAIFLSRPLGIQQDIIYKELCEIEKAEGRGRVFDLLLLKYNVYSKKNVRKCVSIYRSHHPIIKLNKDAIQCLDQFKDIPKYIVTDGNKQVQANKVKALGLEEKVKFVYITYRYGLKNGKPSPYCFHKICARENTVPANVLYIGDNPKKDFIGIKPLGFNTVRIRKGMYKNLTLDERHEAVFEIDTLNDLSMVIDKIEHKQYI